jgi:hypothetical protein
LTRGISSGSKRSELTSELLELWRPSTPLLYKFRKSYIRLYSITPKLSCFRIDLINGFLLSLALPITGRDAWVSAAWRQEAACSTRGR